MVNAGAVGIKNVAYLLGSIVGGLAVTLLGYIVVFVNHDAMPRPAVERVLLPFAAPAFNVLAWAGVLLLVSVVWRRGRWR